MTKQSQLREWVLSSISDDYETLETVLDHAQKFHGTTVSLDQASRALAELIRDGLAQAYELSSQPPHVKSADFDPDSVEELWFYATEEGKRLVRSWNADTNSFSVDQAVLPTDN